MPRSASNDINDAFWASSEYHDAKKKSGRKVVDEDERLRRKLEMAELAAKEERTASGLEEIYVHNKNARAKAPVGREQDPASLLIDSFLEKDKETLECRRMIRNRKKNAKKKAKDAAEERLKAAEAAAQRRPKMLPAVIEENANHAIFFKQPAAEEGENEAELEDKTRWSDAEDESLVTELLESPTTVAVDACEFVPPIYLEPGVDDSPHNFAKKGTFPKQGKKAKKERRGKNGGRGARSDTSADASSSKPATEPVVLSKKQIKLAAKARYDAFEQRVLPGLITAQPLLKLRQHRDHAKELWLRSPENPDHPNHKLFLAHAAQDA